MVESIHEQNGRYICMVLTLTVTSSPDKYTHSEADKGNAADVDDRKDKPHDNV